MYFVYEQIDPQTNEVRYSQISDMEIVMYEIRRLKTELARAKKLGLPATLTIDEWFCILDRYQWKCFYCGGRYEVLEHYIPLVEHGTKGTTEDNCLPACKPCNIRKGSKHPLEWEKCEQERRAEQERQKLRPKNGLGIPRLPIVTNLGHIRVRLGLRPETLACAVKLSGPTYTKAERGKNTSPKTAVKILAAVNAALTDAGQSPVFLDDLGLTISWYARKGK